MPKRKANDGSSGVVNVAADGLAIPTKQKVKHVNVSVPPALRGKKPPSVWGTPAARQLWEELRPKVKEDVLDADTPVQARKKPEERWGTTYAFGKPFVTEPGKADLRTAVLVLVVFVLLPPLVEGNAVKNAATIVQSALGCLQPLWRSTNRELREVIVSGLQTLNYISARFLSEAEQPVASLGDSRIARTVETCMLWLTSSSWSYQADTDVAALSNVPWLSELEVLSCRSVYELKGCLRAYLLEVDPTLVWDDDADSAAHVVQVPDDPVNVGHWPAAVIAGEGPAADGLTLTGNLPSDFSGSVLGMGMSFSGDGHNETAPTVAVDELEQREHHLQRLGWFVWDMTKYQRQPEIGFVLCIRQTPVLAADYWMPIAERQFAAVRGPPCLLEDDIHYIPTLALRPNTTAEVKLYVTQDNVDRLPRGINASIPVYFVGRGCCFLAVDPAYDWFLLGRTSVLDLHAKLQNEALPTEITVRLFVDFPVALEVRPNAATAGSVHSGSESEGRGHSGHVPKSGCIDAHSGGTIPTSRKCGSGGSGQSMGSPAGAASCRRTEESLCCSSTGELLKRVHLQNLHHRPVAQFLSRAPFVLKAVTKSDTVDFLYPIRMRVVDGLLDEMLTKPAATSAVALAVAAVLFLVDPLMDTLIPTRWAIPRVFAALLLLLEDLWATLLLLGSVCTLRYLPRRASMSWCLLLLAVIAGAALGGLVTVMNDQMFPQDRFILPWWAKGVMSVAQGGCAYLSALPTSETTSIDVVAMLMEGPGFLSPA